MARRIDLTRPASVDLRGLRGGASWRRSDRGERGAPHERILPRPLSGGPRPRNPAHGAPRQIGDDPVAEAVRLSQKRRKRPIRCLRSMARASGHAPSTIHRIWRASACSRIARRPSSCRAIPSSWRRSATSSVCIWRRRIVPWFSVSTKRARSRPWTVPSPLADAPRAGGAAQPRLQAPRHDLSLRGPRHRHGRDHRQMFPAPSGPRVPQIPRPRRGERPC